MIQRREDACLALEARHPFGIDRENSRQELDGDVTVQRAVARAIDLAHPAGSEPALDFIGSNAIADRQTLLRHARESGKQTVHSGNCPHPTSGRATSRPRDAGRRRCRRPWQQMRRARARPAARRRARSARRGTSGSMSRPPVALSAAGLSLQLTEQPELGQPPIALDGLEWTREALRLSLPSLSPPKKRSSTT